MGADSILAAGEWYEDSPASHRPVPDAVLARAVGGSLFLHGVVFAGLAGITFLSRQPESFPVDPHDQTIAITLVRRASIPVMPEATEEPGATPAIPNTPEAIVDEAMTGAETLQPAMVPLPRIPEQTRQSEESAPVEPADETRTALDRADTLAMVSTGISRYIDTRRGETTREFVENCIRFRNRYGPNAECPETIPEGYQAIEPERRIAKEIFASVTRDADYARMRHNLARENEYLKELMEAGGLLGEQAEIRWQLNRQYQAYLDGNILPELTFRAQTAFGNDYGRTITPAPYQFSCGFMTACIYEFTGFTVKKPANYVEQASSFVERTPLFMPSEN